MRMKPAGQMEVFPLPLAPRGFGEHLPLLRQPWHTVPPLPALRQAADASPARQPTTVRACDDGRSLLVHFRCEDERIIAPHTRRDDHLYEAEVVEVFLAPGTPDPQHYLEFELNPAGVLFDARITNPDGNLASIEVDHAWRCPGIRYAAERDDEVNVWSAALSIPWRGALEALEPHSRADPPSRWRANLLRIDRAEDPARDEFSCLCPTFTDPADFHRPQRFGQFLRPDPVAP